MTLQMPAGAISIRLKYERSAVEPIGATPILCRRCRLELDLHQPNAERPEDLLGTCSCCGDWYLVSHTADAAEALVIYLPLQELTRLAESSAIEAEPQPIDTPRRPSRVGRTPWGLAGA